MHPLQVIGAERTSALSWMGGLALCFVALPLQLLCDALAQDEREPVDVEPLICGSVLGVLLFASVFALGVALGLEWVSR